MIQTFDQNIPLRLLFKISGGFYKMVKFQKYVFWLGKQKFCFNPNAKNTLTFGNEQHSSTMGTRTQHNWKTCDSFRDTNHLFWPFFCRISVFYTVKASLNGKRGLWSLLLFRLEVFRLRSIKIHFSSLLTYQFSTCSGSGCSGLRGKSCTCWNQIYECSS